jgi:phage-related minor tail protein
VAVVIGEAAIAVRADASGTAEEIQDKTAPAAEKAGEEAGDKLSEKMKLGIAAGLAGVGAAFAEALDREALGDKLAGQLGGSPEYAAEMGAIAGDLYSDAYGESLGEVNDALRNVLQSGLLPEDATNAQIESITASAINLASTFDQDVAGAAQAAGRMVQTGLAGSAEEAMDLLTRGFQQGADAGGDLLDVLSEYGTTFSEIGVTGPQAVGLIDQALAAGIPNADFAADALREMGIIAREGGEGAAEALGKLGLSADDYFTAMQEGGPAASAALDTVLDALRNTEDPALRAEAAAELVGTQYEDLGDAILSLDPSEAAGRLGDLEGAAGELDETLAGNASSTLTSFYRGLQDTFVSLIGGQVIPIVTSAVTWLRDNLGPAIQSVGGWINDNLVPPLQSLIGWLGENDTVVSALAYTVGTVLVAAFAVWGTRSLIEAGKNTLAWFSTAAASSTSAGRQQASALQVVAGWVMMGARALAQGIKIAAVWTAQVVASAVTGAASFAVQVARVVAGWVLMGAQSLLQAARMAAAWVLAMGPVGWIITAVIGLVALIIANWETVKNFTVGVFTAIWEFILGAWEWIKGAVSAGLQAIVDWFMNWTIVGLVIQHWDEIIAFISNAWTVISEAVSAGIQAVVDFFVGLPGAIWGVLSSFGSWLGGIFTDAWNLVSGAVSAGIDAVVTWVAGIPDRFMNNLSNLGSLIAGIATTAWQWFYDNVVTKAGEVISWVAGLPGRILSGIGNLGSLLLQKGKDLMQGLVDGIAAAGQFVGNTARNIVNAVIGFINDKVIDGINGLLEFSIMGITVNPPDIPHIPRLHSGGIFDSGSGEGLALLRDQERVATPEQRVIADRLLGQLLDGTLTAPAPAAAPAAGVTVVNNVTQQPGEDGTVLAARVTQDTVWRLNSGITRRVGAPAGAL